MSGPSAGAGWPSADDEWGSTAVHGSGRGRTPARREPASPRDKLRQVGKESSGRSRTGARPDTDGRGPAGTQADTQADRHPNGRPAAASAANGRPPKARPGSGWQAGGPASRDQQRANRAAEREQRARAARDFAPVREAIARPPQRGLPAWAALIVLFVIAVIGGLLDTIGAIDLQNGFNYGIVAASVIAMVVVKRSHMFPIVIAPPIVYTLGAAFQYYLRASGGNANRAKLDAAANYLVYGFPAIATACAAVLIIAGLRMIIRK